MTTNYVGSAWRSKFLRAPKIMFALGKRDDFVQLDALAIVRLGLKTGNDKFFFLDRIESSSTKSEGDGILHAGLIRVKGMDGQWEGTLSKRDLLPAILNPHQLFAPNNRLFLIPHNTRSFYLHPGNGELKAELADYIKVGERAEVNRQALVTQNADSKRWYRQVRGIITSPWALPYNSGYDYGAWDNTGGAVLNGRFVGVDPREGIDSDLLGAVLNCTFSVVTRLSEGTPTGVEGAYDVGPPAARRLLIPDVRLIPTDKVANIVAVIKEWRESNIMPPAPSRNASIHPLRQKLDLRIIEGLGFSTGEASALAGEVYESYARWRSAIEDTENLMRENRKDMHRNLSERSAKPTDRAAESVWNEIMLLFPALPLALLSQDDKMQQIDFARKISLKPNQPQLQPGVLVLDDGLEIDLGSFSKIRYLSMLMEIGFEPPYEILLDDIKAGAIADQFQHQRELLKLEATKKAEAYVTGKDILEVIKIVERRWFRSCREVGMKP